MPDSREYVRRVEVLEHIKALRTIMGLPKDNAIVLAILSLPILRRKPKGNLTHAARS
jgi:hypothetical protein